jgi:tetratricopeptide (TPR) repeat protein
MGWLYAECEDHERAIEISRAAAERTRNWHHPVGVEMMAYSRINEGDAHLARGDLAAARDALDEIDRLVVNPKTHVWMRWRYSTHLLASQGEMSLTRGDPSGARAFADRCLEVAAQTNSRKFLAWGWRLRGESALARRRMDEAEAALREAAAIAGAIGYLPQLWRTSLALARLHATAGHEPAARASRLAARAALDRLRGRALDPRFRRGFEHSGRVRELADLGRDD